MSRSAAVPELWTLDESMKPVALLLLGIVAVTSVLAKDWVFTGSITDKDEYERGTGPNWAVVFVRIDTTNPMMDTIRLNYNPTNGVVDLYRCCWMGKPMVSLRCAAKMPSLVDAKEGARCRLTFKAEGWDKENKDKGTIILKSLEWISEGVQQGGAANGSQPIRSETNSTSQAAGSRR